ncbi:hypothetical protein ABPG72_020878 [Tetrahymena utriculariae]
MSSQQYFCLCLIAISVLDYLKKFIKYLNLFNGKYPKFLQIDNLQDLSKYTELYEYENQMQHLKKFKDLKQVDIYINPQNFQYQTELLETLFCSSGKSEIYSNLYKRYFLEGSKYSQQVLFFYTLQLDSFEFMVKSKQIKPQIKLVSLIINEAAEFKRLVNILIENNVLLEISNLSWEQDRRHYDLSWINNQHIQEIDIVIMIMSSNTDLLNQSIVSDTSEADSVNDRQNTITADNMQIEGQKYQQNSYIQSNRLIMLPFLSTVTFGAYFNINFQSFVKEQLMTQMQMNTTDYGWFLLIPTLPNIVLPLVVGPFLDFIGARTCLVLFTFITSLVMALCIISINAGSMVWLILGKTLLQIAVESQAISYSALAGKWYASKGLALTFTLQSFSSKIASSTSGIIYPQLYKKYNDLMFPLVLGISLCIITFFTSWIIFYFDKNADKFVAENNSYEQKQNKKNQFKFSDIKKFDSIFWLYAIQCLLMFGAFHAYENYLQTALTKKFYVEKTLAGELVTIPYWIAFGVPLFGLMADKFGKRCIGLGVASCFALVSIFIILVAPQGENYPLICIAFAIFGIFLSSMCAYLYPTLPFLSQKQTLGTGFAICFSTKNGGLALMNFVCSYLMGNDNSGYNSFLTFFVINYAISVTISCLIYFIDRQKGSYINSKTPQLYIREVILKQDQQNIAPNLGVSLVTYA